ncbi:hypothetical protein [Paraburkholderia phymatum]|uniref:hypothetical protein n=1 Tax=Paraburkholderia phymatum TaxID=148447 RepID=UPI0000E75A5A|nr:hypothetical protein [Paraburkholderia phymatum]
MTSRADRTRKTVPESIFAAFMRRFLFSRCTQDSRHFAEGEHYLFLIAAGRSGASKNARSIEINRIVKIFSRSGVARTSAQRFSGRYHLHGINKTVRHSRSKTCRFIGVPQVL